MPSLSLQKNKWRTIYTGSGTVRVTISPGHKKKNRYRILGVPPFWGKIYRDELKHITVILGVLQVKTKQDGATVHFEVG